MAKHGVRHLKNAILSLVLRRFDQADRFRSVSRGGQRSQGSEGGTTVCRQLRTLPGTLRGSLFENPHIIREQIRARRAPSARASAEPNRPPETRARQIEGRDIVPTLQMDAARERRLNRRDDGKGGHTAAHLMPEQKERARYPTIQSAGSGDHFWLVTHHRDKATKHMRIRCPPNNNLDSG